MLYKSSSMNIPIQYKKAFIGVIGSILISGAASAATVITNGSFEDFNPNAPGVFADGGPGNPFYTIVGGATEALPGWTVTGNSIDICQNFYIEAAQGNYSIDLSGIIAGGVEQTVATKPGQEYQVTFSLAGNPFGSPANKEVLVSSVLGSETYQFNTTNSTPQNMNWATETFDFTANNSSTVLSFTSLNNTSFGPELDNVSIQAVPEPSTIACFISGFAILLLMVIRRRQALA